MQAEVVIGRIGEGGDGGPGTAHLANVFGGHCDKTMKLPRVLRKPSARKRTELVCWKAQDLPSRDREFGCGKWAYRKETG